jgi:hypothetical protein
VIGARYSGRFENLPHAHHDHQNQNMMNVCEFTNKSNKGWKGKITQGQQTARWALTGKEATRKPGDSADPMAE